MLADAKLVIEFLIHFSNEFFWLKKTASSPFGEHMYQTEGTVLCRMFLICEVY